MVTQAEVSFIRTNDLGFPVVQQTLAGFIYQELRHMHNVHTVLPQGIEFALNNYATHASVRLNKLNDVAARRAVAKYLHHVWLNLFQVDVPPHAIHSCLRNYAKGVDAGILDRAADLHNAGLRPRSWGL